MLACACSDPFKSFWPRETLTAAEPLVVCNRPSAAPALACALLSAPKSRMTWFGSETFRNCSSCMIR